MTATPSHDGMVPIPVRLKNLPRADWDFYRDTAARYEARWSGSVEPSAIDNYLPEPGHQPLRSLLLIHLIKEEYERRLGHDPAVAMSQYLDRFPELRADPLAVEDLRSWEARLAGSGAEATAAPPPSLPEGYRVLRELARGGMSRLFLIENGAGTRKVLKQIDPARRGDTGDVERFENEIGLTIRLAAKGIGVVPASPVPEVDLQLAYLMPYCAGGSLRDRLRARSGKPVGPVEASRLVVALARTIQKLQDEKPAIVHRDLKPENVLFAAEGSGWTEPLISDLGLAKVLGQDGPTRSGAALGTWAYMSPDQMRDPRRVDGRADIYAMGVILYECLTGRRPFGGETPVEVIHRIYNETPLDPSKLVATVPTALDRVVRKCLEKEPAHRYPTARELAEDLDRFLADLPVLACPPGRISKLRSWAGRHPTEALAYGAAVGALLAGVVISTASVFGALRNARHAETQAVNARREARRADESASIFNETLRRLVERIGQDPRLQAAGMTTYRNDLLHDLVHVCGELENRNPGQASLGLGEALNNQTLVQFMLGENSQAIASELRAEGLLAALPQAYEVQFALANARKQLGVLYHTAGKPADGLKKTEDSVKLYRALVGEKPTHQDARFQLAHATVNLGNYEMEGRNPGVALTRYREALELFTALREQVPANPQYTEWEARTKSNLGLILLETGETEAAVATQREAVATAEQIPDEFFRLDALATCRNNLAEALGAARHPEEAERIFRQALADYRTLAGRFPNDVAHRWSVAMAMSYLAHVIDDLGRYDEALKLVEGASEIFDDLSPQYRKNAAFQKDLATHARTRELIQEHLKARKP